MLTQEQLDRVKVVLVSPRNPLNIGAVARAMANFGFRHLAVASPFAPSWRQARSAVGAPELLAQAIEYSSLYEAVSDCTLVIGTGTLTYRRPEQPVVPLPELAGHPQYAPASRPGRTALVFGSEKHGLTREDLDWCHLMVEVPTDPRQPSMNLGQAVAVCLYELAVARSAPAASSLAPPAPPATASSERLERLAELVELTLERSDYSPAGMRPANRRDLRQMLRRMTITEPDLRRLLGAFRRILWRLDRGPRPAAAHPAPPNRR